MYKGFFKFAGHVMGLFFRPFEGCCGRAKDKGKEKERGRGCGCMPCCKEDDDNAKEKKSKGGILGPGPLTDIMKCMFDASDIDYDYED